MARGDDLLVIVQPVELEMIVHVDRSGLDLRIADFVTVSDAVNVGSLFTVVVNDVVTVIDTHLIETVQAVGFNDAVAVSDAFTQGAVYRRSFADSVAVVDVASMSPGGNITAADVVFVTDSLTKSLTKFAGETVTVSDSVVVGRFINLPISDSVTVTDVLGKGRSVVFADAVAVTDNAQLSAAVDPYFGSVITLLHGDGADGGQNNTFLDSSPTAAALTWTGNPYQGSFAAYASGGGSAFFDTASYLSAPASAAQNLGTGDFTIEFWIRPGNITTSQAIVDTYLGNSPAYTVGQYQVLINTNGTIGLIIADTASTTKAMNTSLANVLVINAWTHVAIVRSAGVIRVFLNGILDTSTLAFAGQVGHSGAMTLGAVTLDKSAKLQNAHLSDVRTSVVARYAAAGNAPVAPLSSDANTRFLASFTNAAAFDTTRLRDWRTVDNAKLTTAKFKYGSGALNFDGVNDILSSPVSADFAFGTNDFTVEFWFNVATVTSASGQVFYDARTASAQLVPMIWLTTTGMLALYVNGSNVITSAAAPSVNVWHHVALARSNGVTKLFLDGVQVGSNYTDANAYVAPGLQCLGGSPLGTNYLNGVMDDVRVTRNVGRYTANFTPPDTAFPNAGPPLRTTNPSVWNPQDKHTDLTIPNADGRTLRRNGGSVSYPTARAYDGRSTGKLYFEAQIKTANQMSVGLADMMAIGQQSAGSDPGGGAGHTAGFWSHDQDLRIGGNYIFNLSVAMLADEWCRIAVDFSLGMVWASKIGGAWNGSATADPATGVGGGALSQGNFVGPLFPLGMCYPNGSAILLNTGQAPFLLPPPNGFSAWGPIGGAVSLDVASAPPTHGFSVSSGGQAAIKTLLSGTAATIGALPAKTTGKRYFEAYVTGPVPSTTDAAVGVIRPGFVQAGNHVGSAASSIGLLRDGTVKNDNGVVISAAADLARGEGVPAFIAVDIPNSKVWIKRQGGANWNNDASQNPETGVGGLTLSGSAAAGIIPALSLQNIPRVGYLNLGQDAYVGIKPGGFGRWDDTFDPPVVPGSPSPIAYRSNAIAASAQLAAARPAGIAVGDVVVVFAPNAAATGLTLTTAGGSPWARDEINWTVYGYYSVIFWKILNATDVANAWNFSATNVSLVAAYNGNGATAVNLRSRFNPPVAGLKYVTLPAFTPTNLNKGLISMVSDRDAFDAVVPYGFVDRAIRGTFNTYWVGEIAERAAGYNGGDAIIWDTGDSTAACGWCLEVV